MKLLKYQLMTEVNHGTAEQPDIQQIFNSVELQSTDATLESNLAIAKAEAYNGEVTVEDAGDDPVVPPTAEELQTQLTETQTTLESTQEMLDAILMGEITL